MLQGCQMVQIFSYQKIPYFGAENFDIFGTFYGIFWYSSHILVGCMYQEKSGNPGHLTGFG
jgi:hypothetical protein